jgi:peptidoglycan/LPS O-acetylase OafA/YrhL
MRIEQLTFTRFIAALLIVSFHFVRGSNEISEDLIQFIIKQANVAVSYFFILSGFVMIIAYHKKSTIRFFQYIISRLARIYPVYLFAIILLFTLYVLSENLDCEALFLNLLMIQAWVPGKALLFNIPGWSLSVELFFYMTFPLLFNYIYSKFNYLKLIFPIIIFWVGSQILFHFLINQNYLLDLSFSKIDLLYFPLMHVNSFLIGNLAGLYFVNKKVSPQNFDFEILGVVLLIILALKFPIGLNFHNGFLALLFAPLILLIAINNGKITALFKSKICIFLGEISFGIYIFQFVVWQWISDYRLNLYFGLDKIKDGNLTFFLRLIILIGMSSLSYIYLEIPIRNKIKNYLK